MSDTDRKKIVIDNKEIFFDELDKTQIYYLRQVESLRKRIADVRFNLDQLQAAENVFFGALSSSTAEEKKETKETA
jgi:hypothetical protein